MIAQGLISLGGGKSQLIDSLFYIVQKWIITISKNSM